MSEELLINVSPMESRVAILNDGVLSELYIERHNKMGLVGNIYVGTVVRVLPGMQAAFVDIGQSRTAFLHVNDMQKIKKPVEKVSDEPSGLTTQPYESSSSHAKASNESNQHHNQTNALSETIDNQSLDKKSPDSQLIPADSQLIPKSQLIDSLSVATQPVHDSHLQSNSLGQQGNEQDQQEQVKEHSTGHFSDKRLKQNYQSTAIHSALRVNSGTDVAIKRISNTSIPPMTGATLPLTRPTAASKENESNTLVLAKVPANKLVNKPNEPLFDGSTQSSTQDNQLKSTHVQDVEGIEQVQSINAVQSGDMTENKVFDSVSDQQADQRGQTTQSEKVDQGETLDGSTVPTFRVLPTVTEILRKDTLNPTPVTKVGSSHNHQPNQADSRMKGHETHPHDDNYAGSTVSNKRQSQINPDELIQNRLREGQQVLVQVTKDQLGTKGARLTTNISLPSRYLVYIPSADNIGVSQRIDNNEERQRLRSEIGNLMQKVQLTGGVIARTAAENISTNKLEEDIFYLLQLWRTIQARQREVHAHQSSLMVYQELSLPLRSIRDLVHEGTERVLIDEANTYEYLKQFAQEFVPMIYPRIVPYHSQQPMFDVFRVEEDLRDALKRRVDLKSGGYLIIDQTEAMTTIDVNTGSYVGGRSLEDTVYKTNLEATHAIARQLRLRNLGGIIILDFIDMQEQEHRDDVLISLQTQLAEDYARTNITQVSELGLVEMTRKRTRESLEQQLCEPCPTCQGKGFIKTAETVCFEIFREIMRCARTYNAPKQFTVVAHASVIDLLLTSEADTVADLEYLLGRVITFEVETLYTQEQYDIVLD